jgi:hypothetical protein
MTAAQTRASALQHHTVPVPSPHPAPTVTGPTHPKSRRQRTQLWPPAPDELTSEWFWKPLIRAALGSPSPQSSRFEKHYPHFATVVAHLTVDFQQRGLKLGDVTVFMNLTPAVTHVILNPDLPISLLTLNLNRDALLLFTKLGTRRSTLPTDLFLSMQDFVATAMGVGGASRAGSLSS